MNALVRMLAGIAFAALMADAAGAAELRPFDAKTWETVRAARAGQPFVLAFWSVYCEPCRREMVLWQEMQRKYPGVPVMLVATDAPADQAMVLNFLERHSPGNVELWAFADEFAEAVRFAVDRGWRGELPRTYFFDASHRAEVRSGVPEHGWMDVWFRSQARETSSH
jgi:thiol-disulfide isomerase/thioredoxin